MTQTKEEPKPGELSDAEKASMIGQFGIFLQDAAYIASCSGQENHRVPAAPDSSSPAPPTIPTNEDSTPERKTVMRTDLNLEHLRTEIQKIGVPLICAGTYQRSEEGSPPVGSLNKGVVFAVDVGNMEECLDHTCLPKSVAAFVDAAMEALDAGAKAVLVSCEMKHQLTEFNSFNFAMALRTLAHRNFFLEHRDEESKREKEKKMLDEGLVPLTGLGSGADSNKSVHQVSTATQNDNIDLGPFHPSTSRQILIKISLNQELCDSQGESLSVDDLHERAWRWWSSLQTYFGGNPKVGICLELGSTLPRDPKILQRWFAERLRAVILPSTLWKNNKAGFPVLSADLKNFLISTFHLPHLTYLIGGTPATLEEPQTHKQQFLYLLHLYKEYYKNIRDPPFQRHMKVLADMPIRPLQPLRDHLTQEIYGVFELDPIKYKLYFEACREALRDLMERKGADAGEVVAMVVGAGRGPLVTQFINAAVELGVAFKVYALDKNPIAICAMLAKLEGEWKEHSEHIFIVEQDMRTFEPTEQADIIISELLGSFGCNELSPECLDGAQRLLKPDGISIPFAYRSFLQPVMAVPMYDDLASFAPKSRRLLNDFILVHMRGYVEIAPYQEVFTFTHPNRERHSNGREICLTFTSDNQYKLCGFAGYFEANLYKDISMNILPDRHTMGLSSWFPAFFALSRQVDVKKGDKIVFHIARRVSEALRKVHYTWMLREPAVLPIQNAPPDHAISM